MAGEAAEFDALCLGTSRRLVRELFLLTGDLGEAEDVVAEAFERAWLRWATVRELDSPEAWVRTVARRLALSRWRRVRTAAARRGKDTFPALAALPVTTLRPADVRRSAGLHRRQRVLRGGAAVIAAVTVAVAAPLLSGPDEPARPAPEPSPDRPLPPGDPLAGAMLRADDITVGSARWADLGDVAGSDPASFAPLHRCDAAVGAEATYQNAFVARTALAGQRILLGLDEEAAAAVAARLEQRLVRCSRSRRLELAAAGTADSTVALTFPTRAGNSRGGSTYAVVLRVGRVVSQVVLTGPPDLDPGRTVGPMVTAAVRRIRAGLPVDAAGGPSTEPAGVTRIPSSFRFAEEETDAGWRTEVDDTTLTRSRDPDAPWSLDPCHPTAYPTDSARTSSLRLTRSGPDLRHNLHLALYPDERTAAEVLAGFRRVLSACAQRTTADGGPAATREVWTYQRLPVGDEALIATAGYTVEDRAVSGAASAAVVRVGNAVFVRVDYREGLPGRPDPATDEVARSAQRNLERICTLILTCARSARPK